MWPGPAQNQRHAVALLVWDPALDPHAVRAHHVAVIGRERHQRVGCLPGLFQRVQNAAELRIYLFDIGVVMRAALTDIVFRDLAPGLRFAAVQSRLSRKGVGENSRNGNGPCIVTVQVLLQRHVGIVRLYQVQLQMPRLVALANRLIILMFRSARYCSWRVLLGAFPIAPHVERLGSRPLHGTLGNRAEAALRALARYPGSC